MDQTPQSSLSCQTPQQDGLDFRSPSEVRACLTETEQPKAAQLKRTVTRSLQFARSNSAKPTEETSGISKQGLQNDALLPLHQAEFSTRVKKSFDSEGTTGTVSPGDLGCTKNSTSGAHELWTGLESPCTPRYQITSIGDKTLCPSAHCEDISGSFPLRAEDSEQGAQDPVKTSASQVLEERAMHQSTPQPCTPQLFTPVLRREDKACEMTTPIVQQEGSSELMTPILQQHGDSQLEYLLTRYSKPSLSGPVPSREMGATLPAQQSWRPPAQQSSGKRSTLALLLRTSPAGRAGGAEIDSALRCPPTTSECPFVSPPDKRQRMSNLNPTATWKSNQSASYSRQASTPKSFLSGIRPQDLEGEEDIWNAYPDSHAEPRQPLEA
mmetsp:Transcript_21029/g.25248  ORF Transcript_21029/g.25248 Transcript_21029/m.25248 type:complete len:382 (+) Transcript_21029:232-1377(+)|eukprot:CAMPEP_0197848230 /NCGR_PEP_ID=MMETSP1438-20131217/7997_1 /TAXON_ID=1461541 /ORGANISM="Pterosperma sp., Strain CCMP1384" /LENGTH=381 /DNA_ID=CAMNT_0043460373 /DNA_START=232 /DNA_END=1377 /DNA_ORIENTATION=+